MSTRRMFLAATRRGAHKFAATMLCIIAATVLLPAQTLGETIHPEGAIITGRPVAPDTTTPQTLPNKSISRYSLTLFPFNSADFGEVSRRILEEYVLEDIGSQADVNVIGYNDIVGLEDHNRQLSRKRAENVAKHMRKHLQGKYKSLTVKGVGEDDPIYNNMLPEGRFFNRTVQIIVVQPRQR